MLLWGGESESLILGAQARARQKKNNLSKEFFPGSCGRGPEWDQRVRILPGEGSWETSKPGRDGLSGKCSTSFDSGVSPPDCIVIIPKGISGGELTRRGLAQPCLRTEATMENQLPHPQSPR